jgi:hypothetical protein
MTASAPWPIDGHMMQVSRLDSARMAGNSRKPTPLKPVARSGSTPAGAVHNPSLMGLAVTAPAAVEPAPLQARSHHHLTPARLEAFVVVAETYKGGAQKRTMTSALSAVGRAIVSVATKAVDPPQLRPLTWVVTRGAGCGRDGRTA